jgi:UDP-N-acetylglucosamine--N-acetylmuramyl-(pentapeptide) pyrophosphoryl-undecaprenol N-acetylglucosamine transferase
LSIRQPYRIIISGGGTGGHVYPAIAIANVFRERNPDAEILFVGAEGRMEMIRVPEAGYKIIGLWISGFQRTFTWSNILFPIKLLSSYLRARKIVKKFKPDAVIGTGGYASGPIMLASIDRKIPSMIQEQNSYAGLTNKRLGEKVQRICVAYSGMEKFFPKDKLVLTGNPVRGDISDLGAKRKQALDHFGFSPSEKTLLIIGGSLGARTINESVLQGFDKLADAGIQVIWQTGKLYFENITLQLNDKDKRKFRIYDFLKPMNLAYSASDVVISRAGALSISELCLAKKPAILVPSPNVAEDHQTRNAKALVDEDAAVLISDADARNKLIIEALKLLYDEQRCRVLQENIGRLGKPNATVKIVEEIERMIHAA